MSDATYPFHSINEWLNFWEPNKYFNIETEFYIPTSKQPFGVFRSAVYFKAIVMTQIAKQNAEIKLIK